MIIALDKSQHLIDVIRDARSESMGSIDSTVVADAPSKSADAATESNCHSKDTPLRMDDDAVRRCLQSIVVLNNSSPDDDDGDDPRVKSLLNKHDGRLVTVGEHLLRSLRDAAPAHPAARVGDCNENLCYEMQDGKQDVRSILLDSQKAGVGNPHSSALHEPLLRRDVQNFETDLRRSLQHDNITYRGSFMKTERTVFQPAHVDYDYPVLRKHGDKLFIAFFPLTKEGAYLQLWKDRRSNDEPEEDDDGNTVNATATVGGTVVYIPYGTMLIVPADTIHGGGFKRGRGGNLRFHLYIQLLKNEVRSVPREIAAAMMREEEEEDLLLRPVNRYTEEHDRRRELCERFVDASGLDRLIGWFFDD